MLPAISQAASPAGHNTANAPTRAVAGPPPRNRCHSGQTCPSTAANAARYPCAVTDNGSPALEDRETITVTVLDTTPPVLTTPGNITVAASGPNGAVVNFTVSAVDNYDPTPTVICSPVAGSTFAIGDHMVTCTATDDRNNSASASFTVSVVVTPATFNGYVQLIDTVLPNGGTKNALISKLNSAQAAFAAGDVDGAIAELDAMLNQVAAREGKKNGLTTQQATQIRAAINVLIAAMEQMA